MANSAHTLTSIRTPLTAAQVIGEILTAWTADDTNGSIPSLTVNFPRDAQLLELLTNPGGTAPTDNYDIVLNDSDSLDVLQGVGANRDTANTEAVPVVYTGSTVHPIVKAGSYTLAVSGNIVNSATGTIAVRYRFL